MSAAKGIELPAVIYNAQEKALAQVKLNGHNIAPGGPFGRSGSMRSFQVVQGDLWSQWHTQTILTLRDDDGRESQIRIYALPAEQNAVGFIEFI